VAKAREIEGLDCEEPFAAAAARVVSVRAAELFDHSTGVLDVEEIERVHAMRVASRRLRAAMEIFAPCFPRKPHRRALKRVKELADVLGERRDPDVAIEFLDDFSQHVTAPDRRGLASLTGVLRAEQDAANDALASYVNAERLESLRRAIAELCTVAAASVEQPAEAAAETPNEAAAEVLR